MIFTITESPTCKFALATILQWCHNLLEFGRSPLRTRCHVLYQYSDQTNSHARHNEFCRPCRRLHLSEESLGEDRGCPEQNNRFLIYENDSYRSNLNSFDLVDIDLVCPAHGNPILFCLCCHIFLCIKSKRKSCSLYI